MSDAGLRRLDGSWPGTGNVRTDFAPGDHPFADDLDLFGAGSLFERLCTARTGAGVHTLASWLLAPADTDEVRVRQLAIAELRGRLDLHEALARLQTKYKLVVLSNGDPDMLEAAKRYHKVPFDKVISVAEANSFKPHVATYTRAAEIMGVRMDEVLFVANHAFDCIGAKSAGMRAAFIDRRRRPFGMTPHQPDILVPSMTALADALV